tara:strand:- start:45 stop:476 length:432 start_codon:yes stop_codon:yes gene_type:complete
MNTFANIDQNRPATFKQFEFAVFKLAEGVAKKTNVNLKHEGKPNPKFKILKSRIGAATAKFYGDQGKKMTHGDAQKFISTGVIPKEILAMVKTDEPVKSAPVKTKAKPVAKAKPKAKSGAKARFKPSKIAAAALAQLALEENS